MTLPWVSRERYEDCRREIADLKAERQVLLDRIALMSGQRPIYHAPESAETSAPSETKMPLPPPSRPTLEMFTSQINLEAEKLAHIGESAWTKIREGMRIANAS